VNTQRWPGTPIWECRISMIPQPSVTPALSIHTNRVRPGAQKFGEERSLIP
jgi:hypothetical protein